MRALRYYGKKDIRIEDVPVPECGPSQVKIKPTFVGICGSDLHEYEQGATLISPHTPNPISGKTVPIVLGHEFSGIIEQVGSQVQQQNRLRVGDRVAVMPIVADQTCGPCLEGRINCCERGAFIGISYDGGLSEHVVVPAECVYSLPENVSLEIGALVEPLAVGWHAVRLSSFRSGQTALVLGAGPIGLAVVQALQARGAAQIIVSEPSQKRAQAALQFGATHRLDPVQEDVVAQCKTLCDGQGVHVVYDTVGLQSTLDVSFRASRSGGTVLNIAVWTSKLASISPLMLTFGEKRYMGSSVYTAVDFQQVIHAMAAGTLDPHAMITRRVALPDVEEKAFKGLMESKDTQIKILVEL